MLSADQGVTWRYAAPAYALPKKYQSTFLNVVACNSQACVAVGSYEEGLGSLPFILTVNLTSSQWQYKITSLALIRNINLADMKLNASGAYIAGRENSPDTRYPKSWPILLKSNPTLDVWKDISDKNNLPQVDTVDIEKMALLD